MNEIPTTLRVIHALCNPTMKTEFGVGITYKKFFIYVKHFIKPFMDMPFIEEPYFEDVFNEIWHNQRGAWQLPRGHGKTEMIGIWLTIYIADYQPFNPFYFKYKGIKKRMTEQCLLAGAATDLDAWGDRLKDYFYKSPYLYHILKPAGVRKDRSNPRWNNKEMRLKNGHTIHLRTLKGKIRGLHIDRLCADDLITESSTLTDKQTIEIWDGAVDGTTTTKEAMVQVIGTPLRFTDIQFHLKNKPEGYFFRARPAIIDIDSKKTLSKRRDYKDLMRTKARIGSTKFSTEYLLNPIDDSVSLIKREHILKCLDKYFEGLWLNPIIERRGTDIHVTLQKLNKIDFRRDEWLDTQITADFAFSDRTTADWSVFSYYGYRMGKWHRLGYIRKQGLSPMEQFNILKALKDYLKASWLGLEENSIKGVLKDVRNMNLPVKLFWMGNIDKAPTYKPEVSFSDKRHIIGKTSSIERLGASFENGLFVIPYKTEMDKVAADLQIEEATSWALDEGKLVEIGRHPDIPITDILLNEMHQTSEPATDVYISGEDSDEQERKIVRGPGIYGET